MNMDWRGVKVSQQRSRQLNGLSENNGVIRCFIYAQYCWVAEEDKRVEIGKINQYDARLQVVRRPVKQWNNLSPYFSRH